MKIDVHLHTKAIKSGDPKTRTIEASKFCEIIKLTDVTICAITNHNHFDATQYEEIRERIGENIQVWPGIELDIKEEDRHGHLLVIVNPKNVSAFSRAVNTILGTESPNSFSTGIIKAGEIFDPLDAIFIPHYFNKAPNISDEDIDLLAKSIKNQNRIIKEASNSISAGIFIGHGHKTIFGSDVKDWDKYQSQSQKLPDLRLPVESFEQFCLLLERNDTAIDTIRNKKFHETISIKPFKDDPAFDVEIWDDINVLFGSKGTGKTDILKALSKHYNKLGFKTSVFESNQVDLSKKYDIDGNKYQIIIEKLPIEPCKEELEKIRKSSDKDVTSIRKYLDYFSVKETSKISNSIKLKMLQKIDCEISKIQLSDTKALLDIIRKFASSLKSKEWNSKALGDELYLELMAVLAKAEARAFSGLEAEFTNHYGASLFNDAIEFFVAEISKKTGLPERPLSTGLSDYATNRMEIELAINKISKNLNAQIPPVAEFVGDLGGKGKLFCKTVLVVQNGENSSSEYRHLSSTTKLPERYVARALNELGQYVYTSSLFEKISALIGLENSEHIKSIEDLLLFNRFFELDHREYKPSNGESAMILLTQELSSDKDIFIIDEPEKSLGNDYISDFIVPLLKEHAYSGKRIIIATHDANIAVRTLPYNSIYREHEHDCYRTYFGNPFSNQITCKDTGNSLDWKETSMRTLEGGKIAFGERGKIYGNA